MALQILSEFVKGPTSTEEIESVTSGRGLFLPPEAGGEVSQLLSALAPADLNAAVVELRNLMPGGDLFHTAVLGLLCGTLVENGADPGAAIDTTLELLVRQLDALAEHPDEATRAATHLTFPAAMTMLCRSKETRKRWRLRPEMMARLDELEEAGLVPFFLREVFTLYDDLDLLILDQHNRRAYSFRLIGVRNRLYHCYALLQDALLRHCGPGYLDAEPLDPANVRFARNDGLTPEERNQHLIDYLRFNFTYPGWLYIPGTAPIADLPTLDGTPFLLIEPKRTHLSWNPPNMYPVVHEALRASCELIREYDRAEADAFLARCGAA
ncbi:MAG: hypothetical protein JWN03_6070 [Nocardia sp.]|uniref:hypothetical protein n=1 Tax=Nocardia sp. TaxID=1821 RepID=UPI00260E8FF4|nr:hypothetical protein [Nocardia sp.]MCU1645795.1 hypothetical protein [Nocardia sp.]